MSPNLLALLLFRAFLIGGCAWLVWHGWSPWWFLLALMLCPTYDGKIE